MRLKLISKSSVFIRTLPVLAYQTSTGEFDRVFQYKSKLVVTSLSLVTEELPLLIVRKPKKVLFT